MTPEELQEYALNSSLPWDIISIIHNTLVQELRTPYWMNIIEKAAQQSDNDIMDYVESINQHADQLLSASDIHIPTAHTPTKHTADITPFIAN